MFFNGVLGYLWGKVEEETREENLIEKKNILSYFYLLFSNYFIYFSLLI